MMNKYLESIQTLETIGTSLIEESLPESIRVLEVNGEPPRQTHVGQPELTEIINQDTISYIAPQKVVVRTYRLRK